MSDVNDICDQIIELSSNIDAWNPGPYVELIQYKARRTPAAANFVVYGLPDGNPGDLPIGPIFSLASMDCRHSLERLVLEEVARALFTLQNSFADSFDKAATDKVHGRLMRQFSSLSYQAHLDSILANRNILSLHQLSVNYQESLSDLLLQKIMKHSFVVSVIKQDMAQGNHTRSTSLLFMIDAIRNGDTFADRYVDWEFRGPSVEVLAGWSRELWKSRESGSSMDDGTKDIALFIGGMASHLFGASDIASSFPFVETTQSFYDYALKSDKDRGYSDKMKQVLQVLTEADFKNWKLMQAQFGDTWQDKVESGWVEAVKNVAEKSGGKYLVSWINSQYQAEQQDHDRSVPNDEHMIKGSHDPMMTSYLLKGTKVIMADGALIPIENVQVGDSVLVAARPAQHDLVSSPVVSMPIKTCLVGFNGQKPWASSAQVFHTTTGLRAIDPEAAHRQNPWLTIRPLAKGHVVYSLTEGKSYEPVEIKTIEKTSVIATEAFDLRLKSESRAHHANGYLMHLNYPEVTLKDVSRLLKAVPSKQQMYALVSLPELRPLLRRWGAQTVLNRLHSDIDGNLKEPAQVQLANSLASELPLTPGSRQSLSPHRPLSRLNKTFRLMPLPDQTKSQNTLPHVTLMDGVVLLDGKAEVRSAANDHTRMVSWSRQLDGPGARFEHGSLKIHNSGHSATGILLLSNELHPADTTSGEVVHINARAARSASTLSSLQAESSPDPDAPGSLFDTTWDMTVDQEPWLKGKTLDQPQKPLSLGTLVDTTEQSVQEVDISKIKIPVLDELKDAINKTLKDNEKIEELYDNHLEIIKTSNKSGQPITVTRSVATLKHAPLLSIMSDQGMDSESPWGRTFKTSLGADAPTLPLLFKSLYFEQATDTGKCIGAAYAFDPNMREGKGQRYLLVGKDEDDEDDEASYRAEVSRYFADRATPGMTMDEDERFQPSPIVYQMQDDIKVTVNTLINLDYSASAVHEKSQDYIFNAMVYHMDKDQRELFTKRSKESLEKSMPDELKTQLQKEVQAFLHNTYAPAFIAQMIGNNSEYRKRLSKEQWDKVWYWWAGNGDACLAKSKWYVILNKIASQCAVRDFFKLNMDQADAKKLAQDLLKEVKTKGRIKQFIRGGHMANEMNKICSLFNALDPDEDLTKSWFQRILKLLQDDASHNAQGKQLEDDMAKTQVYDTMKIFIEKLLDQNSGMTGEVADKLIEDLREFEKQNNIDINQTAAKQAAEIMLKSAIIPQEIAKLLQIATPLAKQLSGTRLFMFAGEIGERVASKVPDALKRMARLFSKTFVVGYLFLQSLSTIGAILNWTNMNDAQKAEAVLQSMKSVVGAATKAVEKWKTWRQAKNTQADLAKDAMVLDEKLSEVSTSDENQAVTIADRDPTWKAEGGVEFTVSERMKQVEIISIEEIPPEELETWNEKVEEPPEHLPEGPVAKETAKELSMTSKALRGLSIALGAAVAAAMTFSLVHDWKNLTTAGKVINTLALVVQILSVLVEGAELLVVTGLITSSIFTAALPIVGAVLAVAGAVLLILTVCGIKLYKEPETKDPVNDFIDKNVVKLIEKWPNPPEPQLTYATDKTSVSGSDTSISISATNSTSKTVSLVYSQTTVYGGETEDCLFTEDSFNKTNPGGTKEGTLTVDSGEEKIDFSLLPHRVGEKPPAFVFNLSLKGIKSKDNVPGYLKLAPGEKITSTWNGHASQVGKSSIIEIVELMVNMDKTHKLCTVMKSS